jgi:hypothetical protein
MPFAAAAVFFATILAVGFFLSGWFEKARDYYRRFTAYLISISSF